MKVFLNGRLVPAKTASVPLNDRGFLYGDGVYETLRVYGGKPFLLHDHLRRLNNSLQGLRITPPLSLIETGRAIHRVIAANKLTEAVIRVTVTRGSGPRGFDTAGAGKSTLAITASPFPGYPAERYRKGIVAAVVKIRRVAPDALPPDIKSANCLNQILARMEASDLGAQEAIMLSADGNVAEASAGNVFMVKAGVVFTPRLDGTVLPGVTRGWTIRIARDAGYKLEERKIPVSALGSADELFVTNSTMEIMPVTRLIFNQAPSPRVMRLGPYMKTSGYVGPVTVDLMVRYRESVRSLQRV
jgi:aminodeoxychorismate lyase